MLMLGIGDIFIMMGQLFHLFQSEICQLQGIASIIYPFLTILFYL